MKSAPFAANAHIAPIPFTRTVCLAARKLKESHLKWAPHVGCFVWDQDDKIGVPSPFPENIYFILNLGHFLKIFHTADEMKTFLVWIPTWYQARLICAQLKIDVSGMSFQGDPENDLLALYKLIESEATL